MEEAKKYKSKDDFIKLPAKPSIKRSPDIEGVPKSNNESKYNALVNDYKSITAKLKDQSLGAELKLVTMRDMYNQMIKIHKFKTSIGMESNVDMKDIGAQLKAINKKLDDIGYIDSKKLSSAIKKSQKESQKYKDTLEEIKKKYPKQ